MAITLADAYVQLRADPSKIGPDIEKGVKAPAEKAGDEAGKSFDEGMRKRSRKSKVPLPDNEDSKNESHKFGGRMAAAIASGLSTAGGPISRALSNVFGTLPPQAQVGIGAGIVGAIAVAAPVIGSALSAAITAGIGLGAVGIGIAAAFQDRRVKAAATGLGEDLKSIFKEIGGDFAPEVVSSLGRIRDLVRSLGIREAFAPAASYLRPLTDGLLGLIQNVFPSLQRAVIAADKPIRAIADFLPRLGSALGSLIDTLASGADEGAAALKMVFDVLIVGIKITEAQIAALQTMFSLMDKAGILLSGPLRMWIDSAKESTSETTNFSSSVGTLQEELEQTADKTKESTAAVREWSQAMEEATNKNLSARAARRALEEAIDDSTKAIKDNGKNLDINTKKGRENQAALDAIHAAGIRAAAAAREQGASTQQANAILERARRAYVEAAVAAGQNRKAVEALSYQLFGLPKNVKGTIRYDDSPARAAISRVVQAAGKVKDIHRGIYYTIKGDLKVPGGTLVKRWGGIDYPGSHYAMQSGGIANVYRGRGRPIVTFAEPATGGEAYIPRFGNIQRSIEILAEAASWYKMSLVPVRPITNERPENTPRPISQGGNARKMMMQSPRYRPMSEDGSTLDDVAELLEKLIKAVEKVAPEVGKEVNQIGGTLRTASRTR